MNRGKVDTVALPQGDGSKSNLDQNRAIYLAESYLYVLARVARIEIPLDIDNKAIL